MTETANLAAALAKFQAEMPTVPKTKTANVGQYSYKYADLADVTEVAMPLLSKHGLSFISKPQVTERGQILTGVLLHESGEREEGSLAISGSNRPQDVGSALTYARRYLFGCMTGIVTDNDDDGQLAQQASKRAAKKAASAPQREPWPDAAEPSGLLDTKGALARAMYAAINKAGIPEEERIEQVGLIIGRRIGSTKEMTSDEARKVLAHLDNATKGESA